MLEWDDNLAPRARKLAAQVEAESGGHCFETAIMAGEWDADDRLIIAMRATMQTAAAEALLRDAVNALNRVPNTRLGGGSEHPDTYKLAAAIDRYFEDNANG